MAFVVLLFSLLDGIDMAFTVLNCSFPDGIDMAFMVSVPNAIDMAF